MHLQSLHLTNVRNYKDLVLTFPHGPVVFVGKNSSGKTNLLEAIEVLNLSRSFRGSHDRDIIRWKRDYFTIQADLAKDNEHLSLAVHYSLVRGVKKKSLFIDGAKTSLIDFLGTLNTVLFSPQDMSLFILPPKTRRRFLDTVLCKAHLSYCRALSEYKIVLLNRNRLLSRIREGASDKSELWYWDTKLVESGALIFLQRREFIDFVNKKLSRYYTLLAGVKNTVAMRYASLHELSTKENTKERKLIKAKIQLFFQEKLKQGQERDILFGATQAGPHRDDISLLVNKKNIMDFGSRGDQRIAILALKLIQKDYLAKVTGVEPILLLDDVFSELDELRRVTLTKAIEGNQVFITTTDMDNLSPLITRRATIFKISDGAIKTFRSQRAGVKITQTL